MSLPAGRIPPLWWVPIGMALVVIDYATGYTLPPPALAPLIAVAAWYSGLWAALPLSVVLPVMRLLGGGSLDLRMTPARFVLGVLALVLIAFLTQRLARHEREMQRRIETLESLLPMCMFCKGIRTADDQWQPLEHYMSAWGTHVTHGICPSCTATRGWEPAD